MPADLLIANRTVFELLTDQQIAEAIGRHIQLSRAGRGLSVDDLAAAAGVTPGELRELEAGRGSFAVFVSIARAVDLAHDVWTATRPKARTLDELERIEAARAENP